MFGSTDCENETLKSMGATLVGEAGGVTVQEIAVQGAQDKPPQSIPLSSPFCTPNEGYWGYQDIIYFHRNSIAMDILTYWSVDL